MIDSPATIASDEDILRLLRRAWHPVALSKDVTASNVRGATLLGEELVLARLSDGLLAADAYCPHKGSKLSLGRVCDGDLQCPTHKWRFDAGGNCINLPALLDPSLQKMAAASLRVHNVKEQYGLIWVQLDTDVSNVVPEVPELARSKWQVQQGEPLRFDCGFRRSLERILDVSRYAPEGTRLPNLYLETFNGTGSEPPGFAARADFEAEDAGKSPLEERHERTYRVLAPSVVTMRQKWSYGERLQLFVASPQTLTKCVVFWGVAQAPGFEGPSWEEQFDFTRFELENHRLVCESQAPLEMPFEAARCGWGVLVAPGDVLSDQFERAFRLWVLQMKASGH